MARVSRSPCSAFYSPTLGSGRADSLLLTSNRVVQLVPGFAAWRIEVCVGVLHRRGSHRLDDRVEALANELLALFARFPHVEDAEDAAVVIEAGRMDQQAARNVLEIERGGDSVVVGGTRIAVLDLELLKICDRHSRLLLVD